MRLYFFSSSADKRDTCLADEVVLGISDMESLFAISLMICNEEAWVGLNNSCGPSLTDSLWAEIGGYLSEYVMPGQGERTVEFSVWSHFSMGLPVTLAGMHRSALDVCLVEYRLQNKTGQLSTTCFVWGAFYQCQWYILYKQWYTHRSGYRDRYIPEHCQERKGGEMKRKRKRRREGRKEGRKEGD